jgi:hypothetical protein
MSEETKPDDNTIWQLNWQSGPYPGSAQFDTFKEAEHHALFSGFDRYQILKVQQVKSHNW